MCSSDLRSAVVWWWWFHSSTAFALKKAATVGSSTGGSSTSSTSWSRGNRRATTSIPGFEVETGFQQPFPQKLPAATQMSALKILSFSYKVKARMGTTEHEAQLCARLGMTPTTIQRVLEMSDGLEKLLLGANLRLVHAVAMNYEGQGLAHTDLVYEGVRGLRHALNKFEPSRGCAFSTYAYPWISEYIRAALSSSLPITLPRHVFRLLMRVKTIQQDWAAADGVERLPTDEELAAAMGISMERFSVVRRAMALAARSNSGTMAASASKASRVQYDETTWSPVSDPHADEGSVVEHVVSRQAQPHAHLERTRGEARVAVFQALGTLPEDEAHAVYSRLFSPAASAAGTGKLNYSALENVMGVESEKARTLFQRGIRR